VETALATGEPGGDVLVKDDERIEAKLTVNEKLPIGGTTAAVPKRAPSSSKESQLMIRKLVLATVFIASTSAAMAQGGGTPEEQAACRTDVRRFCHSIPAGSADGVFLACLQDHRAKLRRACRHVLESHWQ
jgi:hypothetical protein